MNEQKYNNQDITEYLLGSLRASETERFDEFSFTDEDFADALNVAEKDLVDAYVNGELSGETLENFKSYYLASPLRREKVEFARAFQIFAKQNAAKNIENVVVKDSEPKRTVAGFFSSLNLFSNQSPLLQWGFAAAALVFVVLGGLWVINNGLGQPENQIAKQDTPAPSNQNLPPSVEKELPANSNINREIAQSNTENKPSQQKPEKEKTEKPSVSDLPRANKETQSLKQPKISLAIFTLAPSLRSGSRISSFSVSKKISDVEMRLQLNSDDYKNYRVELVDQNNKNIWRSGTLKTKGKDENKFLNVPFPAKLLKSQIYTLQVSGISADGTVEILSDYPFRVMR